MGAYRNTCELKAHTYCNVHRGGQLPRKGARAEITGANASGRRDVRLICTRKISVVTAVSPVTAVSLGHSLLICFLVYIVLVLEGGHLEPIAYACIMRLATNTM